MKTYKNKVFITDDKCHVCVDNLIFTAEKEMFQNVEGRVVCSCGNINHEASSSKNLIKKKYKEIKQGYKALKICA